MSQSSNDRYLDALAALDTDTPISTLVDRVCRAVEWQGKRVRALRPWSEDDRLLLKPIRRGEFAVNGFRNRDLLPLPFPEASSLPAEERRRYSARVTRKLGCFVLMGSSARCRERIAMFLPKEESRR